MKANSMPSRRSPWAWVPSAYFAESLPYVVVNVLSVVMYKRMGVSNTDIAFFTSWLYLPWMIKPLWSPLVDLLRTKRWWIVTMQVLFAAALAALGLAIPMPGWFRWTMIFFWLLAFSSATHDIACDGFYMLGLNTHEQAWFVGVRSTFYRLGWMFGSGILVMLAGYVESHSGLPPAQVKAQAMRAENAAPVTLEDLQMSRQRFAQKSDVNPSGDTPRLVVNESELKIAIADPGRQRAREIKDWAEENNQAHISAREEAAQAGAKEASAWSRYISQPLGNWLREHFGGKTSPAGQKKEAGNLGAVFLRLSSPPEQGREVVVHFGRVSGNKDISLVAGERFVFNRDNWNRPAVALVQLHPNLSMNASAVFRATAGNIPLSWIVIFLLLCALFVVLAAYHSIMLPKPQEDRPGGSAAGESARAFFADFIRSFSSFFRKPGIVPMVLFLLFYRFGEAQLVKLAQPFLLDSQENGGLALTTGQVGFTYGTVGLLCLTIGGLLGGFAAARYGLKTWLWWMALAIKLPDAVYVFLSQTLTDSYLLVNICVGIEQFGYGFGFTAYMLYMIFIAEGPRKTVHFAIATGFMAAGMMIPGMFSGWLQEALGYRNFFIWVLLATIPGYLILLFIPLDRNFGKKACEFGS